MRALVSTSSTGESWLPKDISPQRLNNALKGFLNHSVIWVDPGFGERIRSLIQHNPGHASTVFVDFLRSTPQIESLVLNNIDFTLDEKCTIEDAPSDPRFLSALDTHTRITEVGETRDAAFDRIFGHLLPHAKALELRDQYALENYLNAERETGIQWLVDQRLSRLPIEVNIHTKPPRATGSSERPIGNKSSFEFASSFIQRLNRIENANSAFRVNIFVYSRSRDTHDRIARIAFSKNSSSVELTKGAELFRDDRIREPFKVHPLTHDEYISKAGSWPKSSSSLETITWPNSNP
jgi:hypothetical protein